MLKLVSIVLATVAGLTAQADDLRICGFTGDGGLTVTNTFTNGVVMVDRAATIDGPWLPEKNVFSVGPSARLNLYPAGTTGFFRAQAMDLSGGPTGFTNLTRSYALLTTIAGSGASNCSPCNAWQPSFEGGPATNVALSRPHIAMADRAGNIYIADKEAQAIRKVTPDGNIFTVAGTGVTGYGDTNPTPATAVALNDPNGLWVRGDGSFYILDRGNGLIRKVDTNGIATAVVDTHGPISVGRGLWVSPDESVIYFSAGNVVRSWDSTNGLTLYASGFTSNLGNLAVDPNGRLVVTDRKANLVVRIESNLTKTAIAGNGDTIGGGDGQLATATGLDQVRGIWFLPTGAFFLTTDNGSQVWYVDKDGYIHLFLNGNPFSAHAGDGAWFYLNPALPKVSSVRQITMDYEGNLLVTENDAGFVRKVQFLQHLP